MTTRSLLRRKLVCGDNEVSPSLCRHSCSNTTETDVECPTFLGRVKDPSEVHWRALRNACPAIRSHWPHSCQTKRKLITQTRCNKLQISSAWSQDKYLRCNVYMYKAYKVNEPNYLQHWWTYFPIIISVHIVLFVIKNSRWKNIYNAATYTDILLMTQCLQYALPEFDAIILYRVDLYITN